MVKLKSLPNQGTRTIHLPVVGDAKFENGEVEVDESKVAELLSHSFGFSLIDPQGLSGKIIKNDGGDGGGDGGNDGDGIPTIEELSSLRIIDLKEFFDALVERGVLTEAEQEEYNKMKKGEKAEFIHGALQRKDPETEEEEETEEGGPDEEEEEETDEDHQE